MIIYPVVIPTLCRYTHFKACIESLASCTLADQTELVIGLDYPCKQSHFKGYNQILEYVDHISGFKKVTIFRANENLGPSRNIRRLIDYVFESYDAYISTEDDNVFSPCFLEFMNKCLSDFRNEDKVMSISGYTALPYTNKTKNNLILTYDTSAWGYATWRHKRDIYINVPDEYYRNILKSFKKTMKVLSTYPALLSMLINMVSNGYTWGDTKYTTYNIMHNIFQLRPNISLVRNTGQDGTGLHSGVNKDIMQQDILLAKNYDIAPNSFVNALHESKYINSFTSTMGMPERLISKAKQYIWLIYKWLLYKHSCKNI